MRRSPRGTGTKLRAAKVSAARIAAARISPATVFTGKDLAAEIPADPFGERAEPGFQEHMHLLGGRFQFETSHRELMQIVQAAYAGLPSQRLPAAAPQYRIRLVLTEVGARRSRQPLSREPPAVETVSAGGILCGAMHSASFVALSPQQRAGLIVVSRDMLRFPYHIRYELLEFAVYVLASRVQQLVPLHAACVGRGGRGLLLFGPSGSGKSTLALHCLLRGLEFLAEDSVLVQPRGLLATGVANFLHVRRDSLHFVRGMPAAADIRRSPVIRRRSGVEKLEVDLRRGYRLAATPLRITAVAFASSRSSAHRPLLTPLDRSTVAARLTASQRYAASQPGWRGFLAQIARLPAFELHRGRHPLQAVRELEALLSGAALRRRIVRQSA